MEGDHIINNDIFLKVREIVGKNEKLRQYFFVMENLIFLQKYLHTSIVNTEHVERSLGFLSTTTQKPGTMPSEFVDGEIEIYQKKLKGFILFFEEIQNRLGEFVLKVSELIEK